MVNFGYNQSDIDGQLPDAEKALAAVVKAVKCRSLPLLAERTLWMIKLGQAVPENDDRLRRAMVNEMGNTNKSTREDLEAMIINLEWVPAVAKHYREEPKPDSENTHHHRMIHQPEGRPFSASASDKVCRGNRLAGFWWTAILGIYGRCSALPGATRPVIGRPIQLGLSSIISNLWAYISGKWKGTKKAFSACFVCLLSANYCRYNPVIS